MMAGSPRGGLQTLYLELSTRNLFSQSVHQSVSSDGT